MGKKDINFQRKKTFILIYKKKTMESVNMENTMTKIRNPIEDIKKAIPELSEISNYNNVEYVSYNNFNARNKRIQNHNLKTFGTCYSSYEIYFNPSIICIQSDNKVIEINKKKFKLISDYLKSEEFNRR